MQEKKGKKKGREGERERERRREERRGGRKKRNIYLDLLRTYKQIQANNWSRASLFGAKNKHCRVEMPELRDKMEAHSTHV